MARKEVLCLSSVLLVLLSALTNSTTELVKASNDLNKTEIIYPTAADTTTVTASSSNGSNGTNATVTNATIPISSGDNSTARLAKTFSVVETVKTVKDGFDAALRKPDSTYSSYPSWSSSDNLTMYKASPSRREEKNNQQNSSSSSLTDAIRDMTNRRVTAAGLKKYTHLHRYHPHHQQHQHANDQSQPTTERSLIAQGYPSHHLQPIPDDFETQAQNYDAEYFPGSNHEYEENYNSLSDDLSGGPPGYDDPNPYRYETSSGFFGPPITTNPASYYQDFPAGPPYYQDGPTSPGSSSSYLPEQPGVVSLSPSGPSCHCPSPSRLTRQGCGSMFSEFLGLAGALGGNAWALAQLLGSSAAPFVIPLLVIKLILVPLKVLKFLNLVKIFLKVFIILPFFVRYVYPALYNYTTSLPGMFVQQFHNIFGGGQKPHHPLLHKPHKPRPYEEIEESDDDDGQIVAASATDDNLLLADEAEGDDEDDLIDLEDLEGRTKGNSSTKKPNLNSMVDDSSMWDLRACPSRVACELGAFLAGSTSSRSFPKNLTNFLTRNGTAGNASRAKDEKDEEEQEEIQRNAVYKAFILALVRKWPIDRCSALYICPVLF